MTEPNVVTPLVHAVFTHQSASSQCCGAQLNPAPGDPSSTCCKAPLDAATPEAPHDWECQGCGLPAEPHFECRECGEPTSRVLGDGTEHHAYSDGHPALAARQVPGGGA